MANQFTILVKDCYFKTNALERLQSRTSIIKFPKLLHFLVYISAHTIVKLIVKMVISLFEAVLSAAPMPMAMQEVFFALIKCGKKTLLGKYCPAPTIFRKNDKFL